MKFKSASILTAIVEPLNEGFQIKSGKFYWDEEKELWHSDRTRATVFSTKEDAEDAGKDLERLCEVVNA